MMQIPCKMQHVFEPRPISPCREIQNYIRANGGRWSIVPITVRDVQAYVRANGGKWSIIPSTAPKPPQPPTRPGSPRPSP